MMLFETFYIHFIGVIITFCIAVLCNRATQWISKYYVAKSYFLTPHVTFKGIQFDRDEWFTRVNAQMVERIYGTGIKINRMVCLLTFLVGGLLTYVRVFLGYYLLVFSISYLITFIIDAKKHSSEVRNDYVRYRNLKRSMKEYKKNRNRTYEILLELTRLSGDDSLLNITRISDDTIRVTDAKGQFLFRMRYDEKWMNGKPSPYEYSFVDR